MTICFFCRRDITGMKHSPHLCRVELGYGKAELQPGDIAIIARALQGA